MTQLNKLMKYELKTRPRFVRRICFLVNQESNVDIKRTFQGQNLSLHSSYIQEVCIQLVFQQQDIVLHQNVF